ncbi:SDR family NAD(P)-dependent oxidoreductase [Phytohalomonas tamaricis]|uniref:SDR family NAD(P)-dependent oxidoreductase n=1 Tax=Phytohalomonas tamaricis TaxID=2081032 RepID=UPI000D0B7B24|nr:SDR family NAD(P)-dependent oxidoreductase [Phytohalomonas tamaricis]
MKILVTGAAGFIGFHLVRRLLDDGIEVVGVDNLNSYYSVALKQARLAMLPEAAFRRIDVADRDTLEALFVTEGFSHVIHLAAQAGVRHSITHPYGYGTSNLVGFLNILEACRHHDVRHLLYASSSSVYGRNDTLPFKESDRVDQPASLYAATKRANELMAQSYADLYGLKSTGLRFFTVYGPWGRPDMAPWLFAERILRGEPIDIFNNGEMARDFTYIDDVIEAMVRLVMQCPEQQPPHRILNIGRGKPMALLDFITTLEQALGREAYKNWLPMQQGDVERTWADTSALEAVTGFVPKVSLAEGVTQFANWFKAKGYADTPRPTWQHSAQLTR